MNLANQPFRLRIFPPMIPFTALLVSPRVWMLSETGLLHLNRLVAYCAFH